MPFEEYLSDTSGCRPCCAITWHERDDISAYFDVSVVLDIFHFER